MKEIQGYKGYFIDENRIVTHNGKIQNQYDNGNGYKFVCIYTNGKSKTVYVHRIVAQAFIPNPHNFPQVNHIDCDPSNNKVENLEWCTQSYNIKYAYDLGRAKPNKTMLGKTGSLHHNSRPICQYLGNDLIAEYECAPEASIKTGISRGNIASVVAGNRKTAGGFTWKYKL